MKGNKGRGCLGLKATDAFSENGDLVQSIWSELFGCVDEIRHRFGRTGRFFFWNIPSKKHSWW